MKHNYTSELELKSLLIRIKNDRQDIKETDLNTRINKYIKWHTDINNKKYEKPSKRNITKSKLKKSIIKDSVNTRIDYDSYERFGEIILLMIKNIIKKPQFSGYTYRDDFYSDAVYKILKYLHNFNHTLISERTGQSVNAFAYVSQIIHNSIIFIINTKKKENDRLKAQVQRENMNHSLQLQVYELVTTDSTRFEEETTSITETVKLSEMTSLVHELEKLEADINKCTSMEVIYPKDYVITFEEYNELKPLLKSKVSIMREK
jgi:hypothetical protein